MRDNIPLRLFQVLTTGAELPTGALKPRVLRYLFDQIANIMKPIAIVTALNAVVVTVTYSGDAPLLLQIIWLLPLLGFSCFQYYSGIMMKKVPADARLSGGFLMRGSRNVFIFGFWWSLSAIFFISDSGTMNMVLVALSLGMCCATASVAGPNVGMAAKFMLGTIPNCVVALILTNDPAALVTMFLGMTLAITLIYTSYLKYVDATEMLDAQMNLEFATVRLESALEVSQIGMQITDDHQTVVFENNVFSERSEEIYGILPNEDGLYHRSGRHYKRVAVDGPVGDKIAILEDVTDTVDAQHETVARRKQAETALEEKNKFIDSITSQLTMPVNSIKGTARLLLPDSQITVDDELLESLGDSINSSALELETLISHIQSNTSLDHSFQDEGGTEEIESVISAAVDSVFKMDTCLRSPEDLNLRMAENVRITQQCAGALRSILYHCLANSLSRSVVSTSVDLVIRKSRTEGLAIVIQYNEGSKRNSLDKEILNSNNYPDISDAHRTIGSSALLSAMVHVVNLGARSNINYTEEGLTRAIVIIPAKHFLFDDNASQLSAPAKAVQR